MIQILSQQSVRCLPKKLKIVFDGKAKEKSDRLVVQVIR